MQTRDNPPILAMKLFMAIRDKNLSNIKNLIAGGADLSVTNDGMTPMEYAASINAWECVDTIASCKSTNKADNYQYKKALALAVFCRKPDSVIALIKAGTSANTAIDGHASLLHWAVDSHRNDIIQLLVENGANLAVQNDLKRTPIVAAYYKGYWDSIELIAKTKKVDANDTYHYQHALVYAVTTDRITTVECLLSANTTANCHYAETLSTPLHEAVTRNNIPMIELLLKHDADICSMNAAKQTPIQLAASSQKWKCVTAFAKAKKTNAADKAGYAFALEAAALADRTDIVTLLLAAGTPINAATSKTLLFSSIKRDDQALLTNLIASGADLSVKNENGHTPIIFAAKSRAWNLVTCIAKAKNSDKNLSFPYSDALLEAVRANQAPAAKALLAAGAKINSREVRTRWNAVHYAIGNNNLTLLTSLINSDVNSVNHPDIDNQTPLQLAYYYGNWDAIFIILNNVRASKEDAPRFGEVALLALKDGRSRADMQKFIAAGACNLAACAGELFLLAVKLGKLDIASDVAAAKAPVDHQDKKTGDTALHIAVQQNNLASLRFVLEQGANQAIANSNQITPIELAAEAEKWDCVQLLLEFNHTPHHDKPRIASLHLEQALLIAIKKSNYAIVKLLLEQHAPFDKWNSEFGNIALHLAVKHNEKNPDIVSLLLDHGADYHLKNKAGKTILEVANGLRHTACASRIKKHTEKVKLDRTAAEYRLETNRLFQSMLENAVKPADMLTALTALRANSRALLTSNLATLTKRRDELDQTPVATPAPSLVDVFDPINDKEKLSSLIYVTHTLLNFPNTAPPPFLIRPEDNVEAKDVTDFLKQKSIIDQYANRIKQQLTSLQNEIKHTKLLIQVPLIGMVEGHPTHVKLLMKELDKLPQAQTLDELLSLYIDVLTIFANIEPSPKRDASTKSFYAARFDALKSITLAPPVMNANALPLRAPSLTATAVMQPTVIASHTPAPATKNVYPSLRELQAKQPTQQLSPHFFQRTPETPPPPYSAVAPQPSATEDSIVLMPSVPSKPVARRASDSDLYAQGKKAADSKKSERKTLVMG